MDLKSIIVSIGYIGLWLVIFAESGLLIGIFFPGDSVLFTAGFLASQGYFDVYVLIIGCFIAAVLGDNVGYMFGKKVGHRFFQREDSFFFHKDNVDRARVFYEKYGGKTIILARFIPGVRTIAPIVAGIGEMNYRTFLVFNLIGAILWAIGVTVIGYYLGSIIPGVDQYLLLIVAVIILISILPYALQLIRSKKKRGQVIGWWNKLVASIKQGKFF